MPVRSALAICLAAASPAAALCVPDGGVVLSCTVGGGARTLDVCIEGSQAVYRYGPRGRAPELSLSAHVAEVEHTPWPGIGRAIWETTTFRNGDYAYEVHASFDRFDQVGAGGVTVYRGGSEIASAECDPGSVLPGLWALSDAKKAHGVCRDFAGQTWIECRDAP